MTSSTQEVASSDDAHSIDGSSIDVKSLVSKMWEKRGQMVMLVQFNYWLVKLT